MEQEEMLLMEAKARALQYIVSSGGSMIDNENPQILDVDMGAVLFFDGTWKYLYLDYKNGTISEPIDTLVTREYLYYMRDLGGPIQDKGLVYVLSDTKDPYNTGSSFNLSVIYIGINGELVDTRYFHIDPDGIRNGWAYWPIDFDPTWVRSCAFYKSKNSENDLNQQIVSDASDRTRA